MSPSQSHQKVPSNDPYLNAPDSKKTDILRDVSSLSSMDAIENNKEPQLPDFGEEKEFKEIKQSGYPNNNNYPRKLSKREKKTSTATKSIEDQKLVIRKDFIENR